MKKTWVVSFACAIIVLSFSAARAEYFGAMGTATKPASISLGAGYSHYSDKIQVGANYYNLKQNQIFLQATASIEVMEGYIRVGGANLSIEDALNPAVSGGKTEFKDDTYKAFVTAGGRGILLINPNFSINPFLQATFHPDFKDRAGSQEFNVSFYKVEAGCFFQGIFKPAAIYAGPFIYWLRGEAKGTTALMGKFEEKGNLGGAAGIRIPLGSDISLEIEGQYRQNFSAGGLISYSF